MAKLGLLLLCVFAFVGADADDLADFSNNLATDLGPLLVLFGESMTKQYLSESTSFLDYVIFAMAPIGILTAIISTIRVCGHSSLRAFIGRSQEGDGAIEAELCTSTSRDVCEMFNRGGITRVLGQPRILELVYTPRHGLEMQNLGPNKDNTGLVLSRTYFMGCREPETSDWEIDEGSIFKTRSKLVPSPSSFAPNPNLSLNVGIVKRPRWVFFAIASVGVILQAGVLALAGIGVWVLDWKLGKGGDSSATDYAPVMFTTGTVLMCGGMWSCAFLIGQTTREYRFRRTSQHPSQRSRLFWLQPGPQRIGDQSFDPFAYCEDTEKDPIQIWMSSQKDFNEKRFEFYTYFAALAVLVGYIMQFIGLRGMKAWISLAQMGITVIMSILRGCLRMQRLDRGANKLEDKPDLVSGHELDWLSFEIAQQEPDWHATGQHEQATEVQSHIRDSKIISQCHEFSSEVMNKVHSQSVVPLAPNNFHSTVTSRANNTSWDGCDELLRIRVRLANLTGHVSFDDIEDSEYQKWEDRYVKVRAKAGELSAAICLAAENIISKTQQKDIMLRIQAASLNQDQATHSEQLIGVTLKPPPTSSQASWRIDSAQLEAILGLWMWALVSDERLEGNDRRSLQAVSPAEMVRQARIVSAGPDDDNWNSKANNIQDELNLWLGPNAVEFLDHTLNLDKQGSYGVSTLWQPVSRAESHWKTLPPKGMDSNPTKLKTFRPRTLQRFCGWNPVHRALGEMSSNGQSKLRVQLAQITSTNISLLDLCALELFTALMVSLAVFLPSDNTKIVESAGMVRLESTTVRIFADAFVGSGLGSYSDALLCIVPALRKKLSSPNQDQMSSALMKAAEDYRQKSEWERAEILLQWACTRFSAAHDAEATSSRLFTRALRVTGELYRWSLAQAPSNDARQEFGTRGIEWMTKTFGSVGKSNVEVKEILDCYEEIAQTIAQHVAGRGSAQKLGGIHTECEFVQAIRRRKRTETLCTLCFITSGAFSSDDLQPALPLAVRNNWREVVSALLEMKANPNSQDEGGRTAISYCAEFGYELYVKALTDRGASLDLPEKHQRTPLYWTALRGHSNIAKLLLDTPYVDVNKSDENEQTPLLVAAKNGYEAVAKQLLANNANTESKDKSGRTPLSWATRNGHEAVVQRLLEHGADLESKDKIGRTPLSWAAENGHEAVVQRLLDKGVNIESKDKYGRTPLSWAAENGHEAFVQKLLEKGVNPESKDNEYGRTPLSWAAKNGHEAVVQRLLKKGAGLESKDESGRTPLLWAAENGHKDVVQQLLEKDAKRESKDVSGRTPLLWASENGHEAVVQKLLDQGADLESKDNNYDHIQLLIAARYGHEDIVQQLLGKGANLESKDESGRTPLSWAAENGHEAVVQQLLEKGANLESKDNEYGRTPLSWAAKNGHGAIIQLLES